MRFYMIMSILWIGSGHALPKIESRHQNTYEIKEDKETNSLKFINPDAKKPVLREITYYHLVEKPYDGGPITPIEASKQVIDTEDSSEEDKTERPFTNGHGYQFIDFFPIVLNDTTELSDVDDLVEWIFSNNNDDESTNGDDTDSDEEYYEDDEIDSKEVKGDSNISKNVIVEAVTEKVKNVQAVTTEKSINVPQDDKNTDNIQTEDKVDKEKVSTETIKSTRQHQLFDSPEKLKERFQKMKNFVKVKEPSVNGQLSEIKTNTRRKRSIRKEIPEAPTLPKLNYDGLPDYMKSIILTEKPSEKKEEHNNNGQNKHEKYREEIRRKMEEMFDTVAPDNSERLGDKVKNKEDTTPANNVRTYGMNLKQDGGYVWNNMWNKPGLKYNVGALKPSEESNSFEETEEHTEKLTTTYKPPRLYKPHTTPKPIVHKEHKPVHINSQKDIFDTVTPDNAEGKEDLIKHLNIAEDGIVNIPTNKVRTYGMNLTGDRGYIWNNLWSNPGLRHNIGDVETAEESKGIKANKEEFSKPETTTTHKPRPYKPHTTPRPSVHEEYEIVHHDIGPKPTEDSNDIYVNTDKEYKKDSHHLQPLLNNMPKKEEKQQRTKIEDNKEVIETTTPINKEDENDGDNVPEKLNDLLKNEKLWQWLSDWTGTYMDLLTEHIGTVVKEEISKHMANVKENEVTAEPVKEDNEKEKIQNNNSDEDEQNQDKESYDYKIELIEKQSVKNDVDEDKIENSEKKTIFVDGVELPVTTSSNFDTDDDIESKEVFRNRKNKEDKKEVEIIKDNEPKKEVKVVAENIYGNSLENGKVTNMFFFFDQERMKQVVDDIKPLLNEKNDSKTEHIIIDNRIKEPSFTEDIEKQESLPTEENKAELIQISLGKNNEDTEESINPASSQDNLSVEEKEMSTTNKNNKEKQENLPTKEKEAEEEEALENNNGEIEGSINLASSQDNLSVEEKEMSTTNKNNKEKQENLPTKEKEAEEEEEALENNNGEIEGSINLASSQDKPSLEEKETNTTKENNKGEKELELNSDDKITLETENEAAKNIEVKIDLTK